MMAPFLFLVFVLVTTIATSRNLISNQGQNYQDYGNYYNNYQLSNYYNTYANNYYQNYYDYALGDEEELAEYEQEEEPAFWTRLRQRWFDFKASIAENVITAYIRGAKGKIAEVYAPKAVEIKTWCPDISIPLSGINIRQKCGELLDWILITVQDTFETIVVTIYNKCKKDAADEVALTHTNYVYPGDHDPAIMSTPPEQTTRWGKIKKKIFGWIYQLAFDAGLRLVNMQFNSALADMETQLKTKLDVIKDYFPSMITPDAVYKKFDDLVKWLITKIKSFAKVIFNQVKESVAKGYKLTYDADKFDSTAKQEYINMLSQNMFRAKVDQYNQYSRALMRNYYNAYQPVYNQYKYNQY